MLKTRRKESIQMPKKTRKQKENKDRNRSNQPELKQEIKQNQKHTSYDPDQFTNKPTGSFFKRMFSLSTFTRPKINKSKSEPTDRIEGELLTLRTLEAIFNQDQDAYIACFGNTGGIQVGNANRALSHLNKLKRDKLVNISVTRNLITLTDEGFNLMTELQEKYP